MKISELINLLDCVALTPIPKEDLTINHAFQSDLMSDVLAYVKNHDTILITGLVNQQVVRTAEMIDLQVIVFVRGKRPSEDTIEMAIDNDILLLSTKDHAFPVCGKLFERGMQGIE